MSRYDDGYSHGRSTRHKERSPEYAYAAEDYPTSYEESRRVAAAESPVYEVAQPLKQLTYEPQTTTHRTQSPSNLQVSDPRSRPRSLPPPVEYRRRSRGRRKERGYNKDGETDDSDDGRARSPIEKARGFVDNTFSDTTAGLSIGVLGALVGGLAAREAVDATTKRNSHHDDTDHKRNQLIGTVVGAAVGALGANAVEKRLEVHREKEKIKQEKWERKFRPNSDVVERREFATRPHSTNGGGWKRDWDPWEERDRERERDRDRARNRGVEREVDLGARSWRNVEDWLDDERNDNKPISSAHRDTEDEYRY
ncbi:uncharacterized protein GGS22DRAFT_189044 [Annulohypoxylon maeteangense]|uniref:uncharacterized protein n=1 Tax=Annulohypoxylon maeteangense TaxID=1927788 RepID=UPI00200860A5|nr:uncharacterized protein GGS22DRAFT_189044 [Annulohypoxylon maeteangense]KAI0884833.1 hypothetical protein GGS22DRAFT_189044 [Annulohypoxylon maeteangense]